MANYFCPYEESLHDERLWQKASSVSKQNLNSEFKEKESVSKTFLNSDKRKRRSDHFYNKPQNFIDNKLSLNGVQESMKNTNNVGVGRGAAFQKRMDNIRANRNQQYIRENYDPRSGLLLAPITYQVEEMIGNVYSDAAVFKSLDDVSKRYSSLSSGGNSTNSTSSCGLERAISDISIATSSQRSSEGAESSMTGMEWTQESLLDYDKTFPKLK